MVIDNVCIHVITLSITMLIYHDNIIYQHVNTLFLRCGNATVYQSDK